MFILSFDCSLARLSVCLMENGVVLADFNQEMARGQAEMLMPVIADLLKQAQKDIKSLDCVGVGVGPGSFTGVRVAIAAARGIGMALGIPVYGVNTFDSASFGMQKPLTIAIDTKRGDYYAQDFKESLQSTSLPDIKTINQLKADTIMIDIASDEIKNAIAFPKSLAHNIGMIVALRGDKNSAALPLYLRGAHVSI